MGGMKLPNPLEASPIVKDDGNMDKPARARERKPYADRRNTAPKWDDSHYSGVGSLKSCPARTVSRWIWPVGSTPTRRRISPPPYPNGCAASANRTLIRWPCWPKRVGVELDRVLWLAGRRPEYTGGDPVIEAIAATMHELPPKHVELVWIQVRALLDEQTRRQSEARVYTRLSPRGEIVRVA